MEVAVQSAQVARPKGLAGHPEVCGDVPVYVRCRRLVAKDRRLTLKAAVGAEYGDEVWPAVSAAQDGGKLVLLLDGLDEASALLGGDAVRVAVRAFLADHRGCHVLVASRLEAKPEALCIPLVRVLPVEEKDGVALLGKLGLKTPAPEAVVKELRADPGRSSLAESPLLLTLLASVLKKKPTLPTSRADIYNSAVEHLLHRRFSPEGAEGSKIDRPGVGGDLGRPVHLPRQAEPPGGPARQRGRRGDLGGPPPDAPGVPRRARHGGGAARERQAAGPTPRGGPGAEGREGEPGAVRRALRLDGGRSRAGRGGPLGHPASVGGGDRAGGGGLASPPRREGDRARHCPKALGVATQRHRSARRRLPRSPAASPSSSSGPRRSWPSSPSG